MLAIANSIVSYSPLPSAPVNTTLVAGSVVPVPYQSVAPSVSSVQIGNNARGNSTAVPTAAANETPEAPEQVEAPLLSARALAQTGGAIANAPTVFLAQLAAQEQSPQARGILVQYEKLVAFSNVKYKPSDAFKPEEEPAGVFGRLLHNEPGPPPAPVHAHTHAQARAASPALPPEIEEAAQEPATISASAAHNSQQAAAIEGSRAYKASAERVYDTRSLYIEDLA